MTTALIFHAFEGKYSGLILYSWFNELQTFYMSTICRLWTQVNIWNLKGCSLFSGVEPSPQGPSIGYFTKSKISSRALCQILEISKMFISRGFDSLLKKYCVHIIVFIKSLHVQKPPDDVNSVGLNLHINYAFENAIWITIEATNMYNATGMAWNESYRFETTPNWNYEIRPPWEKSKNSMENIQLQNKLQLFLIKLRATPICTFLWHELEIWNPNNEKLVWLYNDNSLQKLPFYGTQHFIDAKHTLLNKLVYSPFVTCLWKFLPSFIPRTGSHFTNMV